LHGRFLLVSKFPARLASLTGTLFPLAGPLRAIPFSISTTLGPEKFDSLKELFDHMAGPNLREELQARKPASDRQDR